MTHKIETIHGTIRTGTRRPFILVGRRVNGEPTIMGYSETEARAKMRASRLTLSATAVYEVATGRRVL